MTSRVGERGQITVQQAIRTRLGLDARPEAIRWIEDGRLVVEFIPAPHERSLAGTLAAKATRRPATEAWPAVRDAARASSDPERVVDTSSQDSTHE